MVVAVVVAAAWGVGVTPVAALVSAVMAYWRVMMAPTFVMLSTLYPWCLCWALPTSWKSCSSACSRPCRQRCRRRRGRAGGHRPSRRRRRRRRQSPRLMVRWVLQLSDGGGTGGSSSWSSRLSHRAFRGFHPSDAMSSGGGVVWTWSSWYCGVHGGPVGRHVEQGKGRCSWVALCFWHPPQCWSDARRVATHSCWLFCA